MSKTYRYLWILGAAAFAVVLLMRVGEYAGEAVPFSLHLLGILFLAISPLLELRGWRAAGVLGIIGGGVGLICLILF